MKLHLNLMYLVHLAILFTLSHVQNSMARTLPGTAKKLDTTEALTKKKEHNATTLVIQGSIKQRKNETATIELPTQTKSADSKEITHFRRKKRETEVNMPLDFNTIHLPCEWDQRGSTNIVHTFPNHCIWSWNNRFAHEGFYRVYKMYQMEGFTFGQYYERLKRFEVDPHTWEYWYFK